MQVFIIEGGDAMDDEVTELIKAIDPLFEGKDINMVLNALANLALHGIRAAAENQGIGCIGWAYRVADQHAEHIKLGVDQLWQTLGQPQPKTDLEGVPPAGNC
jgi:hypothetical protein